MIRPMIRDHLGKRLAEAVERAMASGGLPRVAIPEITLEHPGVNIFEVLPILHVEMNGAVLPRYRNNSSAKSACVTELKVDVVRTEGEICQDNIARSNLVEHFLGDFVVTLHEVNTFELNREFRSFPS